MSDTIIIASRCAWTLHNFRVNLIRRIEATGPAVVAMGGDLNGFEDRLRGLKIDFRSLPVSMRGISPLGDLKLFFAFYRQFQTLKPKLVHLFTIKPVLYGTLAATLAGVPVKICTITGLGFGFMSGNPVMNFVVDTLYRIALVNAQVVFFQNNDDRDLFIRRGLVAEHKVRMVAGSGVDLDRFQLTPLRDGIGQRPVRFLAIARLLRHKGVMEYIDAAQRLKDAGLAAEFILVGAKDDHNPSALRADDLERLEQSPVSWVGHVDDVRNDIAMADVLVLPSYREGTPRALLEGMAMGRPIITTDAAGCRDLVAAGENGYLVPPRDSVGLMEAMRTFVSQPETIAPMGLAARKFVEEKFSESAVIDYTLRTYAEVLGT